MPRLSSSSAAGSITERSDSAPMRMPTIGPFCSSPAKSSSTSVTSDGPSGSGMLGLPLRGARGDVAAHLPSRERDQLRRGVRALARLAERRPERRDVEHAAAGGDERAVVAGGGGVVDRDLVERRGALDPVDAIAG